MNATWTATGQDVERLIGAVLPHTGGDAHLPMLRCVNVELDGDRLIVVGTDRYTMGAAWTSLTDWHEDNQPAEAAAVRIYAADLKRLFAFLRPQRKDKAAWTLTDDALTVTCDGQTAAIRTVDIEWVKWRPIVQQLTDNAQEATGTPLQGYNPAMVEHFLATAKALGRDAGPMRWYFGSSHLNAPVIRIGDNFVGVLMPVRVPEEEALPLDLTALGFKAKKQVAA